MLRVLIFFFVSGAIFPLSWQALRDLRTHGFYRFFAFESLLGLVLLNAPVWFRDPLCARQMAAWLLGAVSIGLAIEGFRLLRVIGRPAPAAVPSANLAFENTTKLVTVGAYRWIRHPLYASLLALGWGAYLKDPLGGGSVALVLVATGSLVATALAEERENALRFGAAYSDYMKRTWRFVPFVF